MHRRTGFDVKGQAARKDRFVNLGHQGDQQRLGRRTAQAPSFARDAFALAQFGQFVFKTGEIAHSCSPASGPGHNTVQRRPTAIHHFSQIGIRCADTDQRLGELARCAQKDLGVVAGHQHGGTGAPISVSPP